MFWGQRPLGVGWGHGRLFRGGKSQQLVPTDHITFNGDLQQLIFKIKTHVISVSSALAVLMSVRLPETSLSPSSEAGALEGVLGALQ